MGYALDPDRSWIPLEEHAATLEGERQRRLVMTVRDHMEAEVKGRLEPLMATLTAHPIYHFRGNGPTTVLEGHDAVAAFYADMFAAKRQQFEVVVDRIVASDDCVVTEGQVKQAYAGEALAAFGVAEVDGKAVEPNGLYMSCAQLVTLWPADPDGRLIGEDIYFGDNPMTTLTSITAEQLPPDYEL